MKRKTTHLSGLLLCLSALALAGSVAGTMAYYTAVSEKTITLTSATLSIAVNTVTLDSSTFQYDTTTVSVDDNGNIVGTNLQSGDTFTFTVTYTNTSTVPVRYQMTSPTGTGLTVTATRNNTAVTLDENGATPLYDAAVGETVPSVTYTYTIGDDFAGFAGTFGVTTYQNSYGRNALVVKDGKYNYYDTIDEAIEAYDADTLSTLEIDLVGDCDFYTADTGTYDAKGATINGNGYTISFYNKNLSNNGAGVTTNLTIENAKISDMTTSYAPEAWEFSYLEFGGANFTDVEFLDSPMVDGDADATTTFTNCTFDSHYNDSPDATDSPEYMYGCWVSSGYADFENCTFTGINGIKAAEIYGSDVKTITVNNCTFDSLTGHVPVHLSENGTDGFSVTVSDVTVINPTVAGNDSNYLYDVAVPATTKVTVSDITYSATTAAGLQSMIANSSNMLTCADQYSIDADIDMSDVTWSDYEFAINKNFVINGNNHTISKLRTTSSTTQHSGFFASGFLAGVSGNYSLTLKNLNFDNITSSGAIDGTEVASAAVVGVINNGTTGLTFTNVAVTNSTVKGKYSGGFLGRSTYPTQPVNFNSCTLTGNTIQGYKHAGGLAGYVYDVTTIKVATVKDNAISTTATSGAHSAAALVGTAHGNLTATNVTLSGNTFTMACTDYDSTYSDTTYGYILIQGTTYSVNGTELNNKVSSERNNISL